MNEVTIPRLMYAELVKAASDAVAIKKLLRERAKSYQPIEYKEVQLLDEVFNPYEQDLEVKSEAENDDEIMKKEV